MGRWICRLQITQFSSFSLISKFYIISIYYCLYNQNTPPASYSLSFSLLGSFAISFLSLHCCHQCREIHWVEAWPSAYCELLSAFRAHAMKGSLKAGDTTSARFPSLRRKGFSQHLFKSTAPQDHLFTVFSCYPTGKAPGHRTEDPQSQITDSRVHKLLEFS